MMLWPIGVLGLGVHSLLHLFPLLSFVSNLQLYYVMSLQGAENPITNDSSVQTSDL